MKKKKEVVRKCKHEWEVVASEYYFGGNGTDIMKMITNPTAPLLKVRELCRRCYQYREVLATRLPPNQ